MSAMQPGFSLGSRDRILRLGFRVQGWDLTFRV